MFPSGFCPETGDRIQDRFRGASTRMEAAGDDRKEGIANAGRDLHEAVRHAGRDLRA
jgi:hypothetical protein